MPDRMLLGPSEAMGVHRRLVATDSAFLSVGSSAQDKPTVNRKPIDRGYRYQNSSGPVWDTRAVQSPLLVGAPMHRGATREMAADFLRPLLRAVQDTYNVNDLASDLVDQDIRKRRKYEFARPLFLTRTPAVWERQQRGRGVVNSAHQFGCPLRRV